MSICLSMIVKNEAHVLRRALDSAKPFVDQFCIVDTGSTDGTQDIIMEYGSLYERRWIDFATNRNEALNFARGVGCDYVLFLDADDVLSGNPIDAPLTLPGYQLPIHYGDTRYSRCSLVRSDAPWYWKGVIHECLYSDIPLEQGHLDSPIIKILGGGARSLDPEKYKKDVALLEQALLDEPDNARYCFYLAQSYRDAEMPEKALATYQRRVGMLGFVEETFYSMYQAGIIMGSLGHDPTGALLRAFQYRPTRAEPLFQLAKYHRLKNEHALGYMYTKHGLSIPRPDDLLFVDQSIYEWRLLEEAALSAYYVGKKDEGLFFMRSLIDDSKAPADDLKRFEDNLRWYL